MKLLLGLLIALSFYYSIVAADWRDMQEKQDNEQFLQFADIYSRTTGKPMREGIMYACVLPPGPDDGISKKLVLLRLHRFPRSHQTVLLTWRWFTSRVNDPAVVVTPWDIRTETDPKFVGEMPARITPEWIKAFGEFLEQNLHALTPS